MTNGLELGDVYDATVGRIKAQDGDKSRLGMTALMWVSHAERPLPADELCHALAVQLGSIDFDYDNIPSMSTLVSCCQGLITVDKEASTVRLIHFTLQEYLSSRPDIFSKPHSAIAEICLTYLNSQQVKALSWGPRFLNYCSIYWGVHAKKELSDYGISLALELLKENYSWTSTHSLLWQCKHFDRSDFKTLSPFSGLHCASFLGIVEVVAGLIEMECYDINEGDFSGCSPLAWAASNGHEEVVKMLLGREEVNPDKPDDSGRTPLSWAARNGHEDAVKVLLQREEVNPERSDHYGQTPLYYASENGYEGVVEILLRREDVNPDKPSDLGLTPLAIAAASGQEGVIKILLGREEVNPERTDHYGRTPLIYAAQLGEEEALKILLELEGVNPDKQDDEGRTPLSYAAWYGYDGVVKILLEREEVDPDRPDDKGKTPLQYAEESLCWGAGALLRLAISNPLRDLSPRRHYPLQMTRSLSL